MEQFEKSELGPYTMDNLSHIVGAAKFHNAIQELVVNTLQRNSIIHNGERILIHHICRDVKPGAPSYYEALFSIFDKRLHNLLMSGTATGVFTELDGESYKIEKITIILTPVF